MIKETRIETDSIGSLSVPKDAYYGVQTLRGKNNFHITGHGLNQKFIEAMARKLSCWFNNKRTTRCNGKSLS